MIFVFLLFSSHMLSKTFLLSSTDIAVADENCKQFPENSVYYIKRIIYGSASDIRNINIMFSLLYMYGLTYYVHFQEMFKSFSKFFRDFQYYFTTRCFSAVCCHMFSSNVYIIQKEGTS